MARHLVRVRVGDRVFTVEVGRLDERPVTAVIDGQLFEVWPGPESGPSSTGTAPTAAAAPVAESSTPTGTAPASAVAARDRQPAAAARETTVRAPLPGSVAAVLVQPGDAVTRGQELVRIEAMKMLNEVRSPRDGRIRAVPVIVGQCIEHGEALVHLED